MLSSEKFFRLTFVEQMDIIYEIQDGGKSESISTLHEFLTLCEDNQDLKTLLLETLQSLLSKHPVESIHGLKSPSQEYRRICLKTVGTFKYNESLPVLHEILRESNDEAVLREVLSCLVSIRDGSSFPVLREVVHGPNGLAATLVIEGIAQFHDSASLSLLIEVVEKSGKQKGDSEADSRVEKAIDAIGKIGGTQAVSFLLSKFRHKSPMVRSRILTTLESIGPDQVIPFVKTVFPAGNDDMKVMLADLLSRLKDKKGVEILADALIQGHAKSDKVRLVVYQTLASIPCLKSLVVLMDALSEKSPQILHTIVTALDRNIGGRMKITFVEKLEEDEARQIQILDAIIGARAFVLFSTAFFNANIREKLIQRLIARKDSETVNDFIGCLSALKTEESKTAIARLSKRSPVMREINILAVDDSKVILRYYEKVFADLGLGLVTAENGVEGLEMLRKHPGVRLIFADLNMPVMDGIEFSRKVRQHPDFRKIPIIMVTTESEQSQMELAMQAGVSDFITKPFTQEGITERVKELWNNKDNLRI